MTCPLPQQVFLPLQFVLLLRPVAGPFHAALPLRLLPPHAGRAIGGNLQNHRRHAADQQPFHAGRLGGRRRGGLRRAAGQLGSAGVVERGGVCGRDFLAAGRPRRSLAPASTQHKGEGCSIALTVHSRLVAAQAAGKAFDTRYLSIFPRSVCFAAGHPA